MVMVLRSVCALLAGVAVIPGCDGGNEKASGILGLRTGSYLYAIQPRRLREATLLDGIGRPLRDAVLPTGRGGTRAPTSCRNRAAKVVPEAVAAETLSRSMGVAHG